MHKTSQNVSFYLGVEVTPIAHVAIADLRQKFAGIHRELSPTNRPLFSHVTCAIDSQATLIVLLRSTLVLSSRLNHSNSHSRSQFARFC